jgi:putative transcriptional regulator
MIERVENHVYHLRTQKGLTQEELADALSVTRQTVIAIEKGSYAPSVALALKIARVFKVPVEDIFYIAYGKK